MASRNEGATAEPAIMATQRGEAELKQQGAIEAAQDPNSQVSAEDAKRKIVEDSKKAGVLAFNLDTNATPEERLAKAREAIPDGFRNKRRPKGISLVTDLDDDGSAPVELLPEATNTDVVEAGKDKDGKPVAEEAEKEAPYQRTGWAPQIGWPYDEVHEAESLLDHQTFLETQLPDHLFGDWYHNAGVIVFACLSSWFVAELGGGLGWVFIIMAICGTYYRTSIRRVRRNFRDDITREMTLKKLETDHESVEWINAFLLKFWPIYQPVLAQTVINSVDQVLSASTPGFLDSLKLKTFTLGSKPPRMEHVKTLRAEDDFVIMDWMFSFTPNDTADMTHKQIRNKVNPKVVLEIRVGKAMISKGLDVIVEDMSFSGLMRIKMKLQVPFPHIDRVEMSFLERPKIDYVCKPLGGDTFGFDINFIPGLESFIQEQIHATLAPMMYAPNVFPIEVAKMLAGTPVDQAIGVVSITLHGAHGLKNSDNFGNIDPFAQLSINRRQPLAKTKVAHDTANPRWNETLNIIVTSFNDRLDIEVIDYNEFRKSKLLGVASFPLEHLQEFGTYENERLEVISDGKARGVVSCDIRFFPVLEADTAEPLPETDQGILRFTVEQAKDLDSAKSLVGLLNPYAVLLVNGRPVHTTKKLKRTNNPIWENGYTDILIHHRKQAKLGVIVKDDRDIAGDQHLGAKQIKLDDLLQNMEQGKEWYYLDGPNSGRVKMMAQWKPVNITGIAGGTGGYVTPIGVVRLHCKRAVDLRNFETMGKSDPYLRVLQSGIERGRTITFKNNLNPEWDEVLYIPVHSSREKLVLEVMDSEKVGKDRSLGSAELSVGELMRQLESGEYEVNDEKVTRETGLRLEGKKSTEKGTLVYTAAFYPCLNIADPEDEEEEKKKKEETEEEGEAEGEAVNGTAPRTNGKSIDLPRSPMSGSFPPISPTVPRKSGELALVRSPTAGSSPPSPTSPRKSREEPKGPPLVHLSPQELLQYESGLVLVRLLEAELPRSNCHVEVYVDQSTFPSYTSSLARSRRHTFDEIGDCFIRELDCSTLTLKVREKGDKVDDDDKDHEHTLAYLSGETLSTLKQCLNNPTTLKLKSKDEEGRQAWVKLSLKYLPVQMKLDPSESINNSGNLRVEVLDAEGLPAADSNGKSDPFCKFELNGVEVFKTKVQKKTLNPVWNEFFEVPVPSRTAAQFKVTTWDWDLSSNDDFLGDGVIDLRDLEPFSRMEKRITLAGLKPAGQCGAVRIRLLFTPQYIKRVRQGTSAFAGTFAAAPSRLVSGVTGAPSKIGQGVGKSTSFLRRGFRSGTKKEDAIPELPVGFEDGSSGNLGNGANGTNGEVPTIGLRRPTNPLDMEAAAAAGVATVAGTAPAEPSRPSTSNNGSAHSRKKSFGGSSVHSAIIGPQAGTATFTIVSAANYPSSADLFFTIQQIGPKQKLVGKTKDRKASGGVVKFDESFRFACTPDTQFQVSARGKHMLRGDDELGDALYVVDDSGSSSDRELHVGSGTVTIRSSFVPNPDGGNDGGLTPDSPRSTFRRSLLKRDARSREGSPLL